jgi:hypothetical protein
MAIRKLLQKAFFSPQDIDKLTDAFESALHQLNLKDRRSSVAEEVARRIIMLAESGVLHTRELAWQAVQNLRAASDLRAH